MTRADGPVATSYPHDRLSRLADKIGDFFRAQGLDDVRLVVMLNDEETGCVHNVGYKESAAGIAMMLADFGDHFVNMGAAAGVDIDVYANGRQMPKDTGKES